MEINLETSDYNRKEKINVYRQEETDNKTDQDSQDDIEDFPSLEDEEESEDEEQSEEIQEYEDSKDEDLRGEAPQRNLRNKRLIKPTPKYNDYYTNFLTLIGDVQNMSTEEALNDVEWKRAMDDEMLSMDKLNTWILVDPPSKEMVARKLVL